MKQYILIPKVCPVCGGETKIETSASGTQILICTNVNCDGKLINKLDHYCSKKGMDIKGFSKATIEKLIDWGWVNSLQDIFTLNKFKNEWVQKSGFGDTSVNKILQSIEDSCKNVKLEKLIAALGIKLIGGTAAKQLSDYFKTWDNFIAAVENYKPINIKGFGFEMIKSLYSYNYEEIKYIIKNFISFEQIVEKEEKHSSISGKTCVITGKLTLGSRDKVKQMIENAGGKVASAVSSKTNFLINNDIDSTSAKNKKAKELGVKIITEEELLKLL